MIDFLTADLLKLLCKEGIERDARACGFVERRSPITGTAFLLSMMTGPQATRDATLAELSAFLENAVGVVVSPQALDERFGDRAVAFLELCLQKSLAVAASMPHRVKALSRFDHAYLVDSTNFNLAPGLAGMFKGNSGGASAAAMRIQFALDFCTGAMHQEVGDVRLSDPPALAGLVEQGKVPMDGNTLLIADLGYYKTETIDRICQKPGVSFISKVPGHKLYLKANGEPLDLEAKLKARPRAFEEIVVVGGARCRLVAARLDGATAGERIRKADIEANRKNKSGRISEKYRRFLHYSMFLTNLPAEYGMEELYVLYRIRWQVELVFKGWKSVLCIHRQRSAKEARVRCEVYGRLMAATIAAVLEGIASLTLDGIIVSRFRAMKAFAAHAHGLSRAIVRGQSVLALAIRKLLEFFARRCRKTSSTKRPHIEERLENIFLATTKTAQVTSLA
jgi:hypothetical protein